MDREARRVQAERNRRRMPPRGAASRWARRIFGLLATAAFLGAGVAIAMMVMPQTGEESVVQAAPVTTPEPTPEADEKAKEKPKPKGPTKAQLAARKAAVAAVRDQGYTTIKLSDYRFKSTLRVLVGRPVGDAAGGNRAFFFVKDTYVGNDSTSPSSKLTVVSNGKTSVTLSYGVYAVGDTPGQPSGRKRVRFKLEGESVQPLDEIPLESTRYLRRKAA